jgi:Flp pilus assembly pilin Flp
MGVMRRVRVDREVTLMTEMLLRPYIKAQTAIAALRDREEGQGITEYALIIASVAILLIVAMLFLAGKVNVLFHKTGNSVEQPGPLPTGP